MLPPGWERVPLREGTDEAVKKIVDEAVRGLPDDVPRDKLTAARMELTKRLRGSVRQARDNAGLDLYLPVREIHGTVVPASFLVAEFSLTSVVPLNPARVAERILGTTENAEETTVDGASGLRVDRIGRPHIKQEIEHASRRVEYVLPVPRDPERWVVVGFGTVADGDPSGEFADALVELFDAVMTTFRWRRP
jgi:hypothetical protein